MGEAVMRPYAIVDGLCLHRDRDEVVAPGVAAELLAFVSSLAHREVVAGRATTLRIPASHRDDVVSSVVVKLLEAPRRPRDAVLRHPELSPLGDATAEVSDAVRDAADKLVASYVRKMLGNTMVSLKRKEPPAGGAEVDDVVDERSADPEHAAARAHALHNLDRTAKASERTFLKAGPREDFKLASLAAETVEMSELVDAELGASAAEAGDDGARKDAAPRMYKRFERVRRRLLQTLDAIPPLVALEPDERAEVRRLVCVYLKRCQTSSDATSSGESFVLHIKKDGVQ